MNKNNPVVVLGGETIYMDYVEEGICYVKNSYKGDFDDVVIGSTSYVQIGDIPIISFETFDDAISRYNNEIVETKYIRNGNIYSKYEYGFNLLTYGNHLVSNSGSTGKVCMYIPELSCALSVAHPLTLDKIEGVVYSSNAIGLSNDSKRVIVERGTNVIGTIAGNSLYGVAINYDQNRVDKKEFIEIARKDEVKLGSAFLYTDVGEGLNYYEIEICSLTGSPYEYEASL